MTMTHVRPFLQTIVATHETLMFIRVNEEGPVANDLCIKAKARRGSVKQSSFSGLVCSGLHRILGAQ